MEVINLHYSSTGDSEGETSEFSLKLCEEDAISLIEANSHRKIILIGTRLGANICHQINADNIVKRISIDPIFDGINYIKDLRSKHEEFIAEFEFLKSGSEKKDELLGYEISEN